MTPWNRIQRIAAQPWLRPSTVLLICTITLTVTVDAASLTTEERSSGTGVAESRTFGRIRRLQGLIIPVMFFLGVMKTLLAFLVAVSLKTLFVGVSILMINVGLALAKVIAFFKTKHEHYGGGWSGGEKNIHVHIHNDGYSHHGGSLAPPIEFDHSPPAALLHNSGPSVFPSYGPPSVVTSYGSSHNHRSRSDDATIESLYVPTSAQTIVDRYPKILISDRDRLNQIYAQWRQLNKNGR
ncbi:uncharacterized protein LOC118463535 [Anopheles albimanus]|uniref:Uncharacterized protein n=1 Tax=Anopheles albimanus TaxID=7167 RepID=A0A182FDK5_ANOAL|nr:uncharacterized protein LOC118463535 [Anopheles albimanus]